MTEENNNIKDLRQNLLSFLRYDDSLVFKILMFVCSALLVVSVMPENYSFKYDFNKGQTWKYNDLSAPFDFALVKTQEQLRDETELIRTTNRLYFRYSDTTNANVLSRYDANIESALSNEQNETHFSTIIHAGRNALSYVMKKGVVTEASSSVVRSKNEIVSLVYGAEEKEVIFSELFSVKGAMEYISKRIEPFGVTQEVKDKVISVCETIISPDVIYDADMTDVALNEKIEGISPNYGFVAKGKHIISQDEPVSEYAFAVLTSLSEAYKTHIMHSWKVTLGYVMLVFTIFALLFWLLTVFKRGKYFHVNPIAMILANILMSFIMCYVVTRFSSSAIYIVPICMQTIVMRSFLNARVAFMSHLFSVLLCSFLAPNIYMYILVWGITGVACAFTDNEIYHRSKLFGSVGRMTGISIIVAVGTMFVQNSASMSSVMSMCGYLLISGVLMLFAQPVIYVYEKIFGLLSDISLLELTDTNSPLLRLLSQKAPGTFQHSLSVSNIAEQAAREMGANTLLVRVGALYHDVGKLKNPVYFIENQGAHYNPHDDIDPREFGYNTSSRG